MLSMFQKCISLEKLNISNFTFQSGLDTDGMFGYCSDELKINIKKLFDFLEEDAFVEDTEYCKNQRRFCQVENDDFLSFLNY